MMYKILDLYNNKEFFEQSQEFFNNEGFIQLQEIFEESGEFEKVITQLIQDSSLFEVEYEPLIHNKEIIKSENIPASILANIEFFKSKTFEDYISKLVGFELGFKNIEISKFKHKCFELIHDSKVTQNYLIDVYIYITKDEFQKEFGGDKVYTSYDQEILYITPNHNTLTCVYRDSELRTYTKYINCLAKDKEYIQIHCEFEIQESIQDELI